MRDSSSGPMSETVARTGCPCSPYTSQKTTGKPANAGASTPISFRRSSSFGDVAPGWLRPARSPLTSAMKTGTPSADSRSAMTCSVTVLPVPVAPVMRPWRLASAGSRKHSMSPWSAISIGSGMAIPGWRVERMPQCSVSAHPRVAREAPGHPGVSAQAGRRRLQKTGDFCYNFWL